MRIVAFARPTLREVQVVLQAQLAEGFARAVRSAPEGRLEQVLRTPIRRAVLEAIFRQMPQHFDRKAAGAMEVTIRWHITGSPGDPGDAVDTYELQINGGRCRVRRGENDTEPRLTITLDAAELVRLAAGNSDPIKAYFSGRVRLAGDIMLAAKLQSLFRIPGRGEPRQPVSTVSESR